MKLSELRPMLSRIASDLGCDVHSHDGHAGTMLATRDAMEVVLRMPYLVEKVTLEGSVIAAHGGAAVVDMLDAGRARLFARVAEHMRKHGDDPNRRLTEIETMARSLIEIVETRVDLRELADLRKALDETKALLRKVEP